MLTVFESQLHFGIEGWLIRRRDRAAFRRGIDVMLSPAKRAHAARSPLILRGMSQCLPKDA